MINRGKETTAVAKLTDAPYNKILDYYRRQQQEAQANYEVSLDNMRQQLKIMRSENEILRQIAAEYFQNISSAKAVV